MAAGKMSGSVQFACNMSALSPEQRERHGRLERLLRSALAAAHELSNGYDFEFPSHQEVYKALTEITPLEHGCCPFFTIAIRLEQEKLFWQLTGREGAKQFIRMEFAGWFS
jgi:hypothetical protein